MAAALAAVVACGSGDRVENQRNEMPFLGVLEGEISGIPESRGNWSWGDSDNWLCQQWSARTADSGFFYGTNYPWSNADVFVLQAPSDPLEVIAAENFAYSQDSVFALEGDTVFFRGRNGFFGAWTIERIDDEGRNKLSGRWYFRVGGGGDFTGPVMASENPMFDGDCSRR